MDIISIVLIAVGLAMDAFAVSIASGITLKNPRLSYALVFGLFFGVFQFIMPIMGWSLGRYFAGYIQIYAYWIAFLLLAVIGVRMIIDSRKEDGGGERDGGSIMNLRNLTILAVATSIDALAVGITLAVVNTAIWLACAIIGMVAFLFSFVGVMLGKKLGVIIGKNMEVVGGGILVLIGLKILVESLI